MRRPSLERWFPRIATDAELGRKDRRMAIVEESMTGLCSACRDHAGFEEAGGECLSECCGARAINTDYDIDLER